MVSSLHCTPESRQPPSWLCGQSGPCCGCGGGVAGALWTGGGGFVRHSCTASAAEGRAGSIKPAGPGSCRRWKWCRNAQAHGPSAPTKRTDPRTLCYAQRELLPDTVRDLLRTVYS